MTVVMELKATVAMIGLVLGGDAFAQQEPVTIQTEAGAAAECSDFKKEADGAWTPNKYIVISASGCTVIIDPGQVSFLPGMPTACGADIGMVLNQKCGE